MGWVEGGPRGARQASGGVNVHTVAEPDRQLARAKLLRLGPPSDIFCLAMRTNTLKTRTPDAIRPPSSTPPIRERSQIQRRPHPTTATRPGGQGPVGPGRTGPRSAPARLWRPPHSCSTTRWRRIRIRRSTARLRSWWRVAALCSASKSAHFSQSGAGTGSGSRPAQVPAFTAASRCCTGWPRQLADSGPHPP